MLVTLKDVLKDAKRNKYAVGLFNTVSLEMAKGVIAAAEETKSPVIVGTAEVLLPYAGLEELAYFLIPMAKKAKVPVVVHFDHGMTPELIIKSMALGFSSVMYDCSTETYEKNISNCAEMHRIARLFGASVEAELGHVGAAAGAAEEDGGEGVYTEPEQAKAFAERTGVDALAVAIGTAHGEYKVKPELDIRRLREIADITAVPLVLHGGSGLSDEDFKNCISSGISKINIFTDINMAAAGAAAQSYKKGCGMTDLLCSITNGVKKAAIEKMELFGCTDRY